MEIVTLFRLPPPRHNGEQENRIEPTNRVQMSPSFGRHKLNGTITRLRAQRTFGLYRVFFVDTIDGARTCDNLSLA